MPVIPTIPPYTCWVFVSLAEDQTSRSGVNVVLHARTRSKLEEVKREIQAAFPDVQVRVVVQDVVMAPNWDAMQGEIAGLNISVR